MNELLAPFLEMRPTDVLDVVVVTTLCYATSVWIRRTNAAFAAGGLLLLGVLYLIASAFELQLTTWIFSGFFAVALLVLVVVFHSELRQGLEQLAFWSMRRSREETREDTLDMIVRCVAECAKTKTGVLIILPGRQELEPHLRGGVPLEGVVSIPLLLSLFDSSSPGHDGAVLIAGGRVVRFGLHLPLSEDFSQLGGVGTRHSAGLGLAEVSDALCIIVSEERGQISIACGGRLQRGISAQRLAGFLRAFEEQVRPAATAGESVGRVLRENWLEKVVSLLLVLGLWYLLVPGARLTERTFTTPVRFANLPANMEVETIDPPTVDLTLTGPARAFFLLEPQKGVAIEIDGTLASMGRRTFTVSETSLRYPPALEVAEIEPKSIRLSLRSKPAPPDTP